MERRLSAILAADMVGYSRLMEIDEVGTLNRLKGVRTRIIDPIVKRAHGRVFKEIGDGLLIEFPSVVEAVQGAVEIQQAIGRHQAKQSEDLRIQFRIGINLGDVIVQGDDLFGEGVNVAARLEGLADPGGICISGTIFDHLKSKVSAEFEPLGEVKVKNLESPVRAYKMLSADDPNKGSRSFLSSLPKGARIPFRVFIPAVVAVLAIAAWWLLKPDAVRPPADGKPTIAVLPFENLSGDPDQEYLSDGLADDLISDLSKVSGLRVIGRASSFSFKGATRNPTDISRELGAQYVLDGSVRHAGDLLRVNTRLVRGETDEVVWAERYDRAYDNIFQVQNEIVTGIAGALSLQLSTTEASDISRLPTENLEAYDYYLRAESSAYLGEVGSVSEALNLYERAIALDPKFADAYAGYARVVIDILNYGYFDRLPSAVARKRAYEAASRAINLDPNLARSHSVLALLQMLDGAYDSALASAQTAISLSPNASESHLNYAVVLIYAGRLDDAKREFETVIELDPKIPNHLYDFQALAYYLDGDFEHALEILNDAPSTPPSEIRLEILAGANARLGRLEAARDAVQEILKRLPEASVEGIRLLYSHHARKTDLDHRMEALSLAGLPKWPMNFNEVEGDQLSGDALRVLTHDNVWQGERVGIGPFIRHMDGSGQFVERGRDYQFSGRVTTRGDMLCSQSTAIMLDRWTCGPVFRYSESSDPDTMTYAHPSGMSLYRFSAR